ncbi:MAG: HPt (histidine-containing phosphotransfer) domain-containing protein [Vicingaceae bacterium]|jgi:HPt (histidine-containing phosphotransfer) domain-containing protein
MTNPPIFSKTEISLESFKDLLPFFFEEIREDLKVLKQLDTFKDIEEIRSLAHKLKGSSACYAANLMSASAKALQDYVESNNTEQTEKLIKEFEKAMHITHDYAKEYFNI